MTTMPKVVPRVPRWKIELFTSRYNWQEAKGTDIHTSRDESYDPYRCGWIPLDDFNINIFDVAVSWDIRGKPTGTIKIAESDSWVFGIDMVMKAQSMIYYNNYVPDNPLFYPSKAIVYIDNTDIEEHIPHGIVAVSGMAYDGPYAGYEITEDIRVDSPGIYITETTFEDIYDVDVNLDVGEGMGASCTMSVWGKRNSGLGLRECRLYCDTNDDGIYGMVFAGYIAPKKTKLDNYFPIASYELIGYADFLQRNEYVAGYRARYRCANFSKTGQYGTCTANSPKFRAGGSSCYVGDFDTAHPSGVLVTSTAHRCTDYDPDITEPLPYDGWTYDQGYAPDTEPHYEYYPPNYFKALMAVCNMANSLEETKPSSRPWSLPLAFETQLYTDLDEYYNMISFRSGRIYPFSRVLIEDEIMRVLVDGAGAMGVERGAEKTLATTHPTGTKIKCPKVSWALDDREEPVLVKANQLQESNLKHTVMDTLQSLAENATSEISYAEYIAWIDCFKQIQFSELGGPCIGYDSHLVITADDIVEDPTFIFSSVVNKVSAQVNLSETFWVYCEMSTNDPTLIDYATSQELFGICSEEVSNVNLNALVPTEGKVDFQTYATKYLKARAFPRLLETIVLDSFVPDEHYWQDVNVTDNDKKPYLDYTDDVNKHINLLGTTLTAPDFFKPKNEDGTWQSSDFWVEGIKYSSSVEGTREFLTTLVLSRPTLPEEWI